MLIPSAALEVTLHFCLTTGAEALPAPSAARFHPALEPSPLSK